MEVYLISARFSFLAASFPTVSVTQTKFQTLQQAGLEVKPA